MIGINMATYTLTRALSRIKVLKDKLQKSSNDEYIATINTIKKDSEEYHFLQQKLIANAQANADIAKEIIRLKLAVEQSNLQTMVTIHDKQMSVREAIELKHLYENYLIHIASTMQQQLNVAKNKQLKANQEIEKAQEETIKTLANAGVELTQTQIDARIKSSIDTVRLTKEIMLLSFDKSVNAQEAVENYQVMVQSFLDEVDYVLSEINAITKIEI